MPRYLFATILPTAIASFCSNNRKKGAWGFEAEGGCDRSADGAGDMDARTDTDADVDTYVGCLP